MEKYRMFCKLGLLIFLCVIIVYMFYCLYIKKINEKYGVFFVFESWFGGRWMLSYEYNVDIDKWWN